MNRFEFLGFMVLSFMELLNQKLLVLGQAEVRRLEAEQPNGWRGWSILSITDPLELPPLEFPEVRRVERLQFHDVEEDSPEDGVLAATVEDVRGRLRFRGKWAASRS